MAELIVPGDAVVTGFGRLDGDEGFAEVFFDDAFLPDDALPGGPVLGDVGAGWSVAMATTSSEREPCSPPASDRPAPARPPP